MKRCAFMLTVALVLSVQPTIADEPVFEWAIAPAGVDLEPGTVIPEGMVLPPGTILPGGAILPQPPTAMPPMESDMASPPLFDPPGPPPGSTVSSPPTEDPAPIVAPAPHRSPVVEVMPQTGSSTRFTAKSTSGVPHLSGGIGASEREQMEAVKSQYNLRLLFAVAGSGAYLSNIRVEIDDATGPNLLTTVTVGPWFYASLSPGDYELRVTHAGQSQTRTIRIPSTGAVNEAFYWPAQ
ncbi:carboxypeptidase regulatory-like domain-containing protein [Thiocapsa imhoffii]|nr:carboxypeptidase regulatory-like domain-containing protein [Thiocapsa imhoffii]